MFGGTSSAFARVIRITHYRLPIGKVLISPFSLWSIHAGWVATGALVGLIFTIKVVGVFLVHGDYTDPFTRYDAIMPGNPISVLSPYDCSMSESRINGQLNPSYFSCAIFPRDGSFDIIHIEGRDNEITELTFYTTNINLGELALHWNPTSRPKTNGMTVGWNTDGYSVEVAGKDPGYQRPIRIVTVHL